MPRARWTPSLALTALHALGACRTVSDAKVSADRTPMAAVDASVAARDAGPDASVGARPPGPPSRFGIAAVVGGRGRLFPLADGDVVFSSRGYFFLLRRDGGIDVLGELDVERRGPEMANVIDAVGNVTGTASSLRVVTHHGHFRSGYESRFHELGPKGFARKSFRPYGLAAQVGDAIVAYDAVSPVDASPFDPERPAGSFFVARGARKPPLSPSPKFVVTSLAGTKEGALFAIGKEHAGDGPLFDAPDTLLAWAKDDVKPSSSALPAVKAHAEDDFAQGHTLASGPVVLARSPSDVWVAGPFRRLVHGAPPSLAPVLAPPECGAILGAWLAPGERLHLLCAEAHGAWDGDPRKPSPGVLFERTADGLFTKLDMPDRKAAVWAAPLRSAFYAGALGASVDIERGPRVGEDEDGRLYLSAGFAREDGDTWLLAYDREGDRTLLLREGAKGPVRSLDHELTLRENTSPAPAATKACRGVFVSFGDATPELFERAKKALAGEGRTTLFRARVHDRQVVGFYVDAYDAFSSASEQLTSLRKKGLPAKLLCRRPVVEAAEDVE